MDRTRRKLLGFLSVAGFASLNLLSLFAGETEFAKPLATAAANEQGYSHIEGYMDDAFDPDGWL